VKVTRAVVPSLFTVLNIFCGYSAIVQSAQGAFHQAAWFIILAAIFDTLDGVMARITKSSSSFGVEFDSLSDVVSFGAAPSILVYQSLMVRDGGMGLLLSSLPMVLGALRLARFNSQLVGFTKEYFKGLPIPASAMTIAAYVLAFQVEGSGYAPLAATLLPPLVAVVSLLMVSTIKYDTLPQLSRRGILPVLGFYLVTGPVRYAAHFIRQALHPAGKDIKDEEPGMTSIDV
jgi:CDP-diacylglycerol--serine O-phosphatidyltransferase